MATDLEDRNAVIAEQNDLVRAALADPEALEKTQKTGLRFKLVWTPGIDDAFIQDGKMDVLAKAIASFDAFDADNDPYQERDFAGLEIEGTKVFFKIDYYNQTLAGGSENPADPTKLSAFSRSCCPLNTEIGHPVQEGCAIGAASVGKEVNT